MMFLKGSILDVRHGIICHQVNCMGKMGAGLALAIRKKWPVVYRDYMAAYENKQLVPGAVILSAIDPHRLYVANLCGQLNYGRNGQYTIYKAVGQCLSRIAAFGREDLPVYVPKNMGCALAGGDWDVVYAIIEGVLPDATIVER